jgi:hypothetical protein
MPIGLRVVLYKAESLLLERSLRASMGPTIQIIHRFRIGRLGCQVGEEVFQVLLVNRGRRIVIPLSLSLRILVDYLASHRHNRQTATQIASGIRASEFYSHHGRNSGVPSRRKISRTAIKEYIKRIRLTLATVLPEARIPLRPSEVLVSQPTAGSEVLYRLKARVEWVHQDDLRGIGTPLGATTQFNLHSSY